MTKMLVTGGSSPLGERVLPLLDQTADVTCLARSGQAGQRIRAARPTAEVITGDLDDPKWGRHVEGHDTIVHIAGIRLAEQFLTADLTGRRVVVISSASVANPDHPLCETVMDNEQRIAEASGDAIVLRPTMIYGSPRDKNLQKLARFVDRLPVVPVVAGGGLIQPVHCDDIAGLAARAAEGHVPSGVHWAGGADTTRMGGLIELIADGLGKRRMPLRLGVDAVAGLIHRYDLGERHKVLHAIEMLTTDRDVDAVDADLLGRDPLPLIEGVPEALRAYQMLSH